MRQFIIKIVTGKETTLEEVEHMINSEAKRFVYTHGITAFERVSLHRSPFALDTDAVTHAATFRTVSRTW
ncbi:hypothetical protein BSP239C_03191 [Brevibacterium sp. 239c]|nr:hypothetical protein BSP239C_03191 [Brevibacterium sp. 239c]